MIKVYCLSKLKVPNVIKSRADDFFLALMQAESRLLDEENRADKYLAKSTKSKLSAVVRDELVTKYAERLVNVLKMFLATQNTASSNEKSLTIHHF